jgi:mRNA interferase MazF
LAFPTDEELLKAGWIRASRRNVSLHSSPRVGKVYWVDFPTDAYSPEFENMHPGVVIRSARRLADHCIVVPLTHRDQSTNPHGHKLSKNPRIDDPTDAWAVCDHIYTVATGRLREIINKKGKPYHPSLAQADLIAIFTKIQAVLAPVYSAPPPPPLPPPAAPRIAGGRPILSLPRKPELAIALVSDCFG